MVRTLAPKAVRGDDQRHEREPAKEKKRKCVQTACVPCRKRKSKCDGILPACSSCLAVYKTECNYESAEASSASRKRTLENDIDVESTAQPSSEALSVLAASLKTLPENQAADLIQRIQGCKDIDALAKSLQTVHVTPLPLEPRLPDASTLTEQSFSLPGGRMAYGKSSGLHFRSRVPQTGRRSPVQTRPYNDSSWSSVTSDGELVRHLISLYFSWNHAFHPLGSKDLFYQSFERGDCDYCSPLLVNAILAFACHFSDRPNARTNPADARTAGELFWVEAKRLLDDAEYTGTPSITTPQALAIMSMREISMGRDRAGYGYIRRCMTMVIEMGLHLRLPLHEKAKLTAEELQQRELTFWGCFTVDLAWALCAGRIPTLPNSAICIDETALRTLSDSSIWKPYVDDNITIKPLDSHLPLTEFLYHFSSLSKIISDMLFMYYAPNGHINADKVLNFYYRYQAWFQELPWEMRMVDEDSTPAHVLMLHMTYHNCIFQLFGILFNIRFTKSDIRPKDICKRAARSVSELLRIYRRNYTLRRSALMMVHILMWTCMTHLHGLPDAESAEIVVQGMEDFKVLADNHPIGLENITIIQEHAEKQKKSLPSEAAQVVAWALDKLSIPETINEDRESSASSLELPSKSGVNLAEYRPSITAPGLIGTEAPSASLNHPYPASSMVHEAATMGGPSFPAPYSTHMSLPGSSSLHWAPVHDFHHPQAPVAALTAGMLGLSDMLAAHDYERLQRAGFIRAPECERYQPLDPAFYAANDGHRTYMYDDGPQPQYGIRDQAETSKPQMSGSDLGNVPGEYAGMVRHQWYNANRGN